jgi:hypothetical protein
VHRVTTLTLLRYDIRAANRFANSSNVIDCSLASPGKLRSKVIRARMRIVSARSNFLRSSSISLSVSRCLRLRDRDRVSITVVWGRHDHTNQFVRSLGLSAAAPVAIGTNKQAHRELDDVTLVQKVTCECDEVYKIVRAEDTKVYLQRGHHRFFMYIRNGLSVCICS